MLAPRSPLDAYRDDLARVPDRPSLDTEEGAWLLVATNLYRLSQLPAKERPAYARACARAVTTSESTESLVSALPFLEPFYRALRDIEAPNGREALVGEVSRFVRRLEDAGVYVLAYNMLATVRLACEDVSALIVGRVLAQQARIAQQLGELETASELYDHVAALGASAHEPQLRALASFGLGGLALVRGNYPVAREHYAAAVANAESANLEELVGRAHRGLMIVAATSGDIDAALRHGWEALQRAGDDDTSRAELLSNLATLCRDAGHHAAALHGYQAAAALTPVLRVRLPATAGIARSAATLGQRGTFRRASQAVLRMLDGKALPYESSSALLSLAKASRYVDDREGESYRQRSIALAQEYGYFELLHEAEEMGAPEAPVVRVQPRKLSADSWSVVQSLADLEVSDALAR